MSLRELLDRVSGDIGRAEELDERTDPRPDKTEGPMDATRELVALVRANDGLPVEPTRIRAMLDDLAKFHARELAIDDYHTDTLRVAFWSRVWSRYRIARADLPLAEAEAHESVLVGVYSVVRQRRLLRIPD